MPNLNRIACFWALGASCASEGRSSADHPLCRTLISASGEQGQPTRFPSAYVCHGEGDGSTCAPRTEEEEQLTGANFGKAGMHKGSGKATWWVYEDRRVHISRRPGDLTPDIWLDCPGYYAFRGVGVDVGDSEGVSLSPFPLEQLNHMRELERLAGDANTDVSRPSPITAKTSRNLRNSDGMRTVLEDAVGTSLTVARSDAASRIKPDANARRKLDQSRNGLVYAPSETCEEFWVLWPAVHEKAMADGTFLMFDVFPSIGNLFIALQDLLQFVRLLELGLVITWKRFPGFREAFDPGEIDWAVDPAPFVQTIANINQGANPNGFHVMEFNDYSMVLSDPQLDLLSSLLKVKNANRDEVTETFKGLLPKRFAQFGIDLLRGPMSEYEALKTHACAWNMLLKRSPAIMASLEEHSPWGLVMGDAGLHHHPTEYVAWHIRTSAGETATSYDANVHHHVLSEPATVVCPAYLAAMEDIIDATGDCGVPHAFGGAESMVYISSNSKPMSSECTVEAAAHGIMTGHIDLGLSTGDAHTWFTTNPSLTALNAFLDYLFLMDSAAIVRTSSSFSGTVTRIKGMQCQEKVYEILPGHPMYLCLPEDCST